MKKRIPISNLLLMLLALGVLGVTLCEYVVTRNGPAAALQEEEVEESFEEELEEEVERFACGALLKPLLTDADHRFCPASYCTHFLCSAQDARSMGWRLPLRI